MKICIDGRGAVWYRGTGIGTYTFELLKYLYLDSENEYFILLPKDDVTEEVKEIVKPYTVQYISGMKHSKEAEEEIVAYLKEIKADIYHVPQNGIGLPKEKVCKYIATIHDIIPLRMPETSSKSYFDTFSTNIPCILSGADQIITVSAYSKQDMCDYFDLDGEKIKVTYLAAEEMYKEIPKELAKEVMKDKYHVTEDYFLYVGGYGKRKNITTIVSAFDQYKRLKDTEMKLVIAGDVNYKAEEVMNLVEELHLEKDVLLIGKVETEDMNALYNASSVLIYPSLYEGFGLPPLEAMQCGIPVIASNVTSIPEIVKDAAILIERNDGEKIAEEMLHLIREKEYYNSIRERGFRLVEGYNWKKTSMETIAIYGNLFPKRS